ncbi:MAG TPA: hypothetical protein PLN52_04860 [Opitutaceae bacterium]|nr:hypothetical protein [Opitutaceae bacterium]
MDTFNRLLIIAHVAGGVGTLILGPMAMMARKGGKRHVDWGKLYYRLMMWVLISAIVLSVTRRFVFFLVAVTVLSFYSTFTGVRCLYQKGKAAANARGNWLDWGITGLVFLFALGMLGYGLFTPRVPLTLAILSTVFGSLLLIDSSRDLLRYRRPSQDPLWWLYYHISRMIGSYIAAVTAFAVNQIAPRVSPNLQLWVWIGPALIFVPLIIGWKIHYRRKAKRSRRDRTPLNLGLATDQPSRL